MYNITSIKELKKDKDRYDTLFEDSKKYNSTNVKDILTVKCLVDFCCAKENLHAKKLEDILFFIDEILRLERIRDPEDPDPIQKVKNLVEESNNPHDEDKYQRLRCLYDFEYKKLKNELDFYFDEVIKEKIKTAIDNTTITKYFPNQKPHGTKPFTGKEVDFIVRIKETYVDYLKDKQLMEAIKATGHGTNEQRLTALLGAVDRVKSFYENMGNDYFMMMFNSFERTITNKFKHDKSWYPKEVKVRSMDISILKEKFKTGIMKHLADYLGTSEKGEDGKYHFSKNNEKKIKHVKIITMRDLIYTTLITE